jgi:hypothetical protein
MEVIKKYVCSVCGCSHETPEAALACESVPIVGDEYSFAVGDEVLVRCETRGALWSCCTHVLIYAGYRVAGCDDGRHIKVHIGKIDATGNTFIVREFVPADDGGMASTWDMAYKPEYLSALRDAGIIK